MKHTKVNITIHFLMCALGGFLGGYALLLRGGFGSAATGNLVECMIEFAEHKPMEALIRLGGGLAFTLPFMLSKWLEHRTRLNREKLCLWLEIVGFLLCSFIPADFHPVLALYPIFFLSSFQWSIFYGTEKYNCATIFISNNTRQTFSALADYWLTGKQEMKEKAVFYGVSVLCFLLLCLGSALLVLKTGPMCLSAAAVIPIAVLVLMKKNND